MENYCIPSIELHNGSNARLCSLPRADRFGDHFRDSVAVKVKNLDIYPYGLSNFAHFLQPRSDYDCTEHVIPPAVERSPDKVGDFLISKTNLNWFSKQIDFFF